MPRVSPNVKVLKPVQPNAGLEASYRQALEQLIEEMSRSYSYWIEAAYKANEPRIAQDAPPYAVLQRVIRRLGRRWEKRFEEAAPKLAAYFAQAAAARSDNALASILRKAGMTVKFRMSLAARDIIGATVEQNVALIKSIPAQYHTEVQGMVMRSVQTGRDLGQLSDDLIARFGVTKRRAALIARDQNQKATSAMQRARQTELGITEAIWIHSGGGKEPRPTHVANNGKRYNVKEGWYDPAVGEHIWPGELISCRCVSRAVMPGL